jgi:hypothetical protein
MEPTLNFDLDEISNLKVVFQNQINKFNEIRGLVKDLKFIPVEPIGDYTPISFAAYDGGRMGLDFDPFQLDFIEIADSYGNDTLKFLLPTSQPLHLDDLTFLENIPQIKNFLGYLQANSMKELCQFPPNTGNVMEIAEMACIFTKLCEHPEEPLLILKDGFLRNKILQNNPKRKLVGVAKKSKILDTVQAILLIEKIIPRNYTGFIPLPSQIEKIAYKWPVNITKYPFGKLYIAKLSSKSNLLLTIEIPYDFENDEAIYSDHEIREIFGCLVKNSRFSFPTLGYPQTIMRAHEKAVRTGFTASIWREKIIRKLLEEIGSEEMRKLLKEAVFNQNIVDKRFLGGI